MQVPPAGRAPRLTASPGHPPQLEVEAEGSGANTDFSSHSDQTVISATFPDER